MERKEFKFAVEYGIKSMEFACCNDTNYKATFVDEQGETWTFQASRQKVLEHVERFARHPERYLTNKALVVAHFHNMAMAWYTKTHFPKDVLETLT